MQDYDDFLATRTPASEAVFLKALLEQVQLIAEEGLYGEGSVQFMILHLLYLLKGDKRNALKYAMLFGVIDLCNNGASFGELSRLY